MKKISLKIQEKNVKFKKGRIELYRTSGIISKGTLSEDTVFKVQGKDVKFRSEMSFYENGNIKSGRLIEDTMFKA